ncbi:MAG: hypothetical protein ABFD66_09170, partial [Smithella sp.]
MKERIKMNVIVDCRDRDGVELQINDWIELFDWGGKGESLGTTKIIWDESEGQLLLDKTGEAK